MTPRERTRTQGHLERGLFHLLNGETAHGLAIVDDGEAPPKGTRTYMLVLNIGWADEIIAERMSLAHARGIAYVLADALECAVGDVEDED